VKRVALVDFLFGVRIEELLKRYRQDQKKNFLPLEDDMRMLIQTGWRTCAIFSLIASPHQRQATVGKVVLASALDHEANYREAHSSVFQNNGHFIHLHQVAWCWL
jgi:hypothetical protein